LKVSKPVLVVLVLAILFAGYTFLFTGKKRPAKLLSPQTATTEVKAPVTKEPADSTTGVPDVKAMNLAWRNDPFLLPKALTDKKTERQKAAPKLVAIMEGRQGRYAIIGEEIVKTGDMIGEEKVAEIGKDKVTLVHNKTKRILSIEDR
jgi:hypothetical protein